MSKRKLSHATAHGIVPDRKDVKAMKCQSMLARDTNRIYLSVHTIIG